MNLSGWEHWIELCAFAVKYGVGVAVLLWAFDGLTGATRRGWG